MIDACSMNENGGYVKEHFLLAKHQADSVIAKRFNEKKVTLYLLKIVTFQHFWVKIAS